MEKHLRSRFSHKLLDHATDMQQSTLNWFKKSNSKKKPAKVTGNLMKNKNSGKPSNLKSVLRESYILSDKKNNKL